MPGHHDALNDSVDVRSAVNPQSITSGAAVNGATIDTQGWDGVEFVINMGAFTGSGALDAYVQSGANANASDMANVANAALTQVAAANNNNVAVIDIYRPTNRYVRLVLLQSVNTVVAGGTAILYRHSGNLPPTKSAQQTVKLAQN